VARSDELVTLAYVARSDEPVTLPYVVRSDEPVHAILTQPSVSVFFPLYVKEFHN
jgi:hypothetical protein